MSDMIPDERLVDAASKARANSYAPYSDFHMGAAVRTERGDVVVGAVVENVSLGLAMCAERVALFGVVAGGQRPRALALVSARTAGRLTWPCGACLQVALEFGGPDLAVLVSDLDGVVAASTVGRLLPNGPHRQPTDG